MRNKVKFVSIALLSAVMLFPLKTSAEEIQGTLQVNEDSIVKNDDTGIPDPVLYDFLDQCTGKDGVLTKGELLSVTSLSGSGTSSEKIKI